MSLNIRHPHNQKVHQAKNSIETTLSALKITSIYVLSH